MADTSCCRNDGGKKHLPGCANADRSAWTPGKALLSGRNMDGHYEADKERQGKQGKRSLIGKKFKTRPMDAQVARDCHVEKKGDTYMIVEDKDRGSWGGTA